MANIPIEIKAYVAQGADWNQAWNAAPAPDQPHFFRVGCMNAGVYPPRFWQCVLTVQPVAKVLPFDLIIQVFKSQAYLAELSVFRIPNPDPLPMAAIAQLPPIFTLSDQTDSGITIKDMGDTGEPLIFLVADRRPEPRPTDFRQITGAWLNMADPAPLEIRDSGLVPVTTSGLRPESSGLVLTTAGEQLINFKSGFVSC